MKRLRLIPLYLLLLVIGFSSCSKDKKMEINMQSKEGTWNIDNVTWTIVKQTNSGQVVANGSTNNCGTFTFDKDGSGSYSYKIDTISRSGSFNWQVDDQKAILNYTKQSFSFSGTITQKVVAYTGTQPKKNELVLEGSETDQTVSSGINQFVITGTFYLSKQ